MRAFTLDHLSDDNLLAGLAALVATDRQTTAAMLAHLAEVEVRGLYRPAACSSMHAYCVRVLRLSEDAASKRLRAARVARQWPQIFEAVADGRLHLSAVVMLAPQFADGNVDDLIAAAAYRTKVEIEMLVARLAPQPDLPEAVVPIDPRGGAEGANPSAPGRIPPAPERPPVAPDVATRVKALAPERFGLQVTISQETRDKLERAQALLRHRNPRGDLAAVIDRALDALLLTLEREKFGATSRPRATKPRAADADPRYVSREVRRIVHARDGEQCSFVSADGVRCTERAFLEFDHSTPVALGGQPTTDEVRLLCHSHNQYEAERRLGADFMREKRRAARARRRGAAHAARTDAGQPVLDQAMPDQPTPDQPAGSPHQPRRTAMSGQPTRNQTPDVDTAAAEREAEPRAVDTAATERAAEARAVDADVTLALRGMGFGAAETRRAMANIAQDPVITFEARLRAALAALTSGRSGRCSDGPLDLATSRLAAFLSCA